MKLYHGVFNYQRQVVEEFTRANSMTDALRNITARLAARFGVSRFTMRQYFDGKRPNYEIVEVDETKPLIDKVRKPRYNGVERRKHGTSND